MNPSRPMLEQVDTNDHYIPNMDTFEHECSHLCWCEPDYDVAADAYCHHAHDERYLYIQGIRPVS